MTPVIKLVGGNQELLWWFELGIGDVSGTTFNNINKYSLDSAYDVRIFQTPTSELTVEGDLVVR